MTENIMQCCYTNAEQEIGGKISSGWQPVAVTNNIPSDAYNGCVKLQNANSAIQSHMVDERGNVLNLFEITGDGAYVYVSRTQYGLVDRLGRPNMFSHAYIFSWKMEEVISDPNVILTLARSNFVDNEDAAKQEKTGLLRREPFSLQEALQIAGMDAKAYLTLIQCVYSQYSERKSAKPIYVQYDGSDEQMQAILYSIYYGIPHYMRRNLSIASAVSNTAESKNLIFSEYATKNEAYLVPRTGENNILTPRASRKIARYGFVDYAARNYETLDVSAYFAMLEKTAIELGDSTASNELVLKIAHLMIEDTRLADLSDSELDSRLSDALRSKSYGSQRMESYISDMLDEVRARKMFLTEESEANLADRLTAPATDRLADAGEQYNIYRFSSLSIEEAAKMLSNMAKTGFGRYSQSLSKSKKGLQILDHYYAEYALVDEEVTWETLNRLLDETGFMSSRLKTTDFIDAKAWELYYTLLDKQGEAVAAYNSLMELMGRLYGEENKAQHVQSAKEAYWERKSFKSFSYADLAEYKVMSDESEKCSMFAHLYAVLDTYKNYGDNEFLMALNKFFLLFRRVIVEGKLSNTILTKVEEESKSISTKAMLLFAWMKVAALADAKELFAEVLKVKNAFKCRDYEAFVETYQKIVEVSSFSRNSGTLTKALSKAVVEDCKRTDCNQTPIPLDVWLLLGSSQYSNSFQLFDVTTPRPCVLDQQETFVVVQSKLLWVRPYSLYAEEYIQNRGAEAKTVRKWLNEQKMVEKRRRADERRARNENEGSFLDRGLSFISQFAADDSQQTVGHAEKRTEEGNNKKGSVAPVDTDIPPVSSTASTNNPSANDTTPSARRSGTENAPFERRGFTQPEPEKDRKKQDEKPTGKKGFFKELFGRK